MRAGKVEFGRVVCGGGIWRYAIIFAFINNIETLCSRFGGCFNHVKSLPQPIYMANFIAIISRNRQFLDLVTGKMNLDKNFRIKMKII